VWSRSAIRREATEFLKAEVAKWGKVIRMAKVKVD
jgi:hypothetical protein